MPKFNSWDVSYPNILFFESALRSHERVADFIREKDIFFRIIRREGLGTVNTLLVNLYTVGLADYFRAKDEFPEMDCLVTAGDWNGYTEEAKDQAIMDKNGLFVPSEFFGALWIPQPYKYVKKDDKGKPIYHYK